MASFIFLTTKPLRIEDGDEEKMYTVKRLGEAKKSELGMHDSVYFKFEMDNMKFQDLGTVRTYLMMKCGRRVVKTEEE